MNTFDLQDIWRLKHPTLKRFTWRGGNSIIQSRLDYWLIFNSLHDYVEDTDVLPSIKSDHSAIFLHINSFKCGERGRGYWKLNSTIINEEEYINQINTEKDTWIDEYQDIVDCRVRWELIKYRIWRFSQKYSNHTFSNYFLEP